MGANIKVINKRLINNEIVANLEVKSSKLKGCCLDAEMSELMIDEYPILSIAASFADSPSVFKGLKELRVKESDRLELIRLNLERCGVDCAVKKDDLYINPSRKYDVKDNRIITSYDHRIAMAFSVMGGMLNQDLNILESKCINTSFPNFIKIFNKIGGNLIE